MAKTVQMLHHYTLEGLDLPPGAVVEVDNAKAAMLIRNGLAFGLPFGTAPTPHPNPFPMYVTVEELVDAFEALGYTSQGASLFDARDQTLAARDQAVAVGNSSDTIQAGNITTPGSATDVALANGYASRTARKKHAPAFGLYFPEAEGGTNTAAVQAAMTTAAAAKGRVVFSSGVTYACATPLTALDDLTLELAPGSNLQRTTSHAGAFIANTSYSTKINRFRIIGPGKIGSTSTAVTGQVIFLYGNDIELSDFTVDTYAGGQAILIGGDRNRMRAVKCINPDPVAGAGGIRMYGGTDFVATACHVVSGDDALQFTPIASAGHPLANLSIDKALYVGCTGGSMAARFKVAALSTSPPGAGGLTNSITNSGWIGCHGYAKNRGIVITNTDSSGEIANIYDTDGSVNMTGSTANGQDILINRNVGAGRVRDIYLTRVRVSSPAATALGTTVAGNTTGSGVFVENVVLTDCILEAPGSALATLKPLAVDGFTVRGGRVVGAGTAHVIEGGTGVNASKNITIDGPKITGVGDGFSAVRLPETVGLKIEGLAPVPLPGATTPSGVGFAAGASTRCRVSGCDFTDMLGGGVIGTIPVGTQFRDNRGFVTKVRGTDTIAASGTTKAVTHGLGFTPTDITLIAGNTEALAVTLKNSVTFTVARAASGVAHTFTYTAEYVP